MLVVTSFSEKPTTIVYEEHDSNRVWLRKDIKKVKDEDGNISYQANEVYFETSATKEEVETDFDKYFEFGKTWENPTSPTLEERVKDLEDALSVLMG